MPGSVSEVQVGGPERNDEPSTPFSQLMDGGLVRVVRGSQGADMIVLRLRLRGSAPPSCVAVDMLVADARGQQISEVHKSLRAYPEGVGELPAALVQDIYLPGPYDPTGPAGPDLLVTARAAGVQTTVRLRVSVQSCLAIDDCVFGCSDDACAARCLSSQEAPVLPLFLALDSCRRSYCVGDAADMGASPADMGTSDGGTAAPLRCTASACLQCLARVQRSAAECAGSSDCGQCAAAAQACLAN